MRHSLAVTVKWLSYLGLMHRMTRLGDGQADAARLHGYV